LAAIGSPSELNNKNIKDSNQWDQQQTVTILQEKITFS
jgi:hypothetical protein